MRDFILSIDQSTAGTKALLLNRAGNIIARSDYAHRQIIDDNGFIEHDPNEIYGNVIKAVGDVVRGSGVHAARIECAAISNQRETAIVWDKNTGEPVCNAIVWQCARGLEACMRVDKNGADMIKRTTGIPLSPYYSAAKIAWVLEHVEISPSKRQVLCCSTMDSWLVYKLCGGSPKTDYSNASRTQLFDLHTLSWSGTVCGHFGIEPSMLPEVRDSDSVFGYTDFEGILPHPIPINAVLGDSHGALFGQGCTAPGMIKATYGTGSSIMMNTGLQPVFSDKGIVTSLAWRIDGKTQYVLEGNVNYTGAVIKWLVDDMRLLQSSREAGKTAASVPHTDGLYLVPAFSGLGAPYFDDKARGIICGITRGIGYADIVRAAEECIAYQITDVLDAMRREAGIDSGILRTDGGPSADAFLMQFQADISRYTVWPSGIEELSGVGAAYAAGIARGFFNRDIMLSNQPRRVYEPALSEESCNKWYTGWKEAVQMVLNK